MGAWATAWWATAWWATGKPRLAAEAAAKTVERQRKACNMRGEIRTLIDRDGKSIQVRSLKEQTIVSIR